MLFSSHIVRVALGKRVNMSFLPVSPQAVFQFDVGTLMEQVGTGKESLSFMKRRMRRLAAQWAAAARRLHDKLRHHWREQKTVNF